MQFLAAHGERRRQPRPDGNGIQVCERIRAVHPTLPVVTISAVYCAAQARRAALDAGADAYLLEPTPPARLIATVRRLTSGKKQATPLPDAVIRTTHAGRILWANASAATLLNLSDRALRGRDILPFFNGERGRVQTEIRRAGAGQTGEFEAGLRPRDRAPVGVSGPDGGMGQWPERAGVANRAGDTKRFYGVRPAVTGRTQTLWHLSRPSSPMASAVSDERRKATMSSASRLAM